MNNPTSKKFSITEPVNTQLHTICKNFSGNIHLLEGAIGCLVISHYFGWRVAKIVHGKHRWNKYKKLLGIEIEQVCEDVTELSSKNIAFKVWKETGRYWDVVMDRIKIPEGKQTLT